MADFRHFLSSCLMAPLLRLPSNGIFRHFLGCKWRLSGTGSAEKKVKPFFTLFVGNMAGVTGF
jgi:hypothetical protein